MSTADPSLVLSEDGGRVEARAPDATMNARLRKGTGAGRRDLPKHLLYPRVNIGHRMDIGGFIRRNRSAKKALKSTALTSCAGSGEVESSTSPYLGL